MFVALALACVAGSAQASAPPVEDYGKLPAMDMVTLSPSGQRYAFIAAIGDKRELVVATTANAPLDAEDLGETKIRGVQWVGDDHLLVFFSATVTLGMEFTVNKQELGGVVVIDLKDRKAFSVFGSPYETRVARTVVGSYGAAQIDGRWWGFFGAYTHNTDGVLNQSDDGKLYPDLYRVDLDSGAAERIAPGQNGVSGWLVAPTGEVAARLIVNNDTGAWRLLASRIGEVTLASGLAPTGDVGIDGFSRTGGDVLLRLGGDDHDVIKAVPLAGGEPTAIYDADEVGTPLFDRVNQLWIGSRANDDEAATTLFAPVPAARLRGAIKAFPGSIVHLVSYSADFGRMIVSTEGGDDSGTYWIVDIGTGSADILGRQYPTVTPANVGSIRWVEYKAADGLTIRGVLTLPPGRDAKNLPLVVMPHGGPESHDQLRFDYWAQAFAARGYAVFQPNFRGSNGRGNGFRDAGYGQWGRKMQTDISDGVAELVGQGVADPRRACIVGWSYGGYAALAGVTVQHGLYRCAVSMAGVSDPAGMIDYARTRNGETPDSATRYWRRFMGIDTADISPLRLADRADAPILLIHGLDDTVVPIDQSRSMERALRRADKPVEVIALPGADHWLLHEDARVAMLKASVAFVLKYDPPDPASPAR
jgi:dipeptidyl aminopeptidase/acylaminoacyl peptidase